MKLTNNKEVNNNDHTNNICSSKKNNPEKENQIKLNTNCKKKIKNNVDDSLKINLKYNLRNGIFIYLSNTNLKKNNNKLAKKIEVSCEKPSDHNLRAKNLNSSNSKRSLLVKTKTNEKPIVNINPNKNTSKNKTSLKYPNPFREQKIIPIKFKNGRNEKNVNNNTSNCNIINSESNNNNNNKVLNLNFSRAVKDTFLKNKNLMLGTEKINSKNKIIEKKSRNIQDPNYAFKSTGSIDGTTVDANYTNTNTNSNTNAYITYNNGKKYRKPFQNWNYLNNSESHNSKFNKKAEMNCTCKTHRILSRNLTSTCYMISNSKNKTGVLEKNKKNGIPNKIANLINNNINKALQNNSKKEKHKTIIKMEKNMKNEKNKEIISNRVIKRSSKMKK